MPKGYAAPDVEPVFTRARDLCQRANDTPRLLPSLSGLGSYYFVRGDLRTAKQVGGRYLSLAYASPDPVPRIDAHGLLALVTCHLGDMRSSLEHVEQSLALYEPSAHGHLAFVVGHDPAALASAIGAIGLWWLGYPDQAAKRGRQAVRLARPGGRYRRSESPRLRRCRSH